MELETQLQNQLFELHSLQARLEALLETAQQHSAPQLSVHVLESRHPPARGRLSLRLLSEGRHLMTREVQQERSQTVVSWLETFSFPVQALDGELRVQVLEHGQLQSTGSVRLKQLLDQERHDLWLSLERAEVRLALRLIHSPEICFKHALQLVQTKAARTEVLLLSCSRDRPHQHKDVSVHCILSFKVARARHQLRSDKLLYALLKSTALQLLGRAQAVSQRRLIAATVIAKAYRRYRQRTLQTPKPTDLDTESAKALVLETVELPAEGTSLSASEGKSEGSEAAVGSVQEESAAELGSDSDSQASSDSEVNYYDPAARQNRFGRR